MTKRAKLLQHALGLYRASRQLDLENKNYWGMIKFVFWFPGGPKYFKTTDEMRQLVKKMVLPYTKKS
jgi:hypothetical protein